ncbi:hypothetical protein D3C81_1383070 [compost metagenome]
MGEFVFFAEDWRVGRIERAHRGGDHQHTGDDHQHLVEQTAKERPITDRPAPDQRRRQYTEQQHVSQQLAAEQRGGFGGVGFEDVLHHHRVDGDAVFIHEIRGAGREQGDHGEHRFQCPAKRHQCQQQGDRGPQKQRERGEKRQFVRALQGDQSAQRLPGRQVVQRHQRQGKQQHQPGRRDGR